MVRFEHDVFEKTVWYYTATLRENIDIIALVVSALALIVSIVKE